MSLKIIPDLDSSSKAHNFYSIGSQSHTLLPQQTSTASLIERSELERRNFYCKVLAPPESQSGTKFNSNNITEDQALALKRLHDFETYRTKQSKETRTKQK